jgi:hypothetical protein
MTLGLSAAGTDLDSLFALYISGTKAANTGIEVAGADLSSRYQALAVSGTQRANVGIEHGGADIAALFAQYGSGAPTPSPTPTCIWVEMMLSPSLRAGDALEGDWFDGVGFTPHNHLIPQQIHDLMRYMSPCIRIVTEHEAELVASESTPMPLHDQPAKLLQELVVGDEVFTCINGRYHWDKIVTLEKVGELEVVLFQTDVQCYFAGKDPNRRVASHIPHSLYAMPDIADENMVARPMLKPPS